VRSFISDGSRRLSCFRSARLHNDVLSGTLLYNSSSCEFIHARCLVTAIKALWTAVSVRIGANYSVSELRPTLRLNGCFHAVTLAKNTAWAHPDYCYPAHILKVNIIESLISVSHKKLHLFYNFSNLILFSFQYTVLCSVVLLSSRNKVHFPK
jgi:hypothetical protein